MLANIMIIRGGGLGDTLLALRAVHALNHHFRPCRITWAGNPAYLPILPLAINLSQTQSTDGREFALLRTSNPTSEEILKSFSCNSPFDLLVAWTPGNETFEENLKILANQVVRKDPHPPTQYPPLHASDYLLTTLSPIGIKTSHQPTELPDLETTKEHFLNACQTLSTFGLKSTPKIFPFASGERRGKKVLAHC